MDVPPAATVEWNQVQAALEACVDEELLERIILRVLSQHPKVCKNVARALIDGIEEKPHHGADGTDHSERRTQVHLATGESDISTKAYVHNASEEAPHSAGGTDCIESGTHVHFATAEGDTSAKVMPQLGFRADLDITEFIEAIMDKEISPFGNYFEHAAAWAREAEAYPDMVRLVVADRLGSLDPKEVKASLEEIAEFLEIPTQAAARLAASTFDRPAFAEEALQQDTLVIHEALSGGHLVEQSARNLHVFEEALAMASPLVHKIWRQNVASWFECKSGCLKQIAESTIAGVASTPPLALTFPMKGPAAHASGTCRPCVFATRGICKETAAMCRYCHSEEHLPPKRASRKVRKMRKELQGRSARALSPDPFD